MKILKINSFFIYCSVQKLFFFRFLVMRKGPDGSVLPPTALNRKLLYEEKYGESGTTILSLETALQWKFNKFLDSTNPVTWPALPLRLVYDE